MNRIMTAVLLAGLCMLSLGACSSAQQERETSYERQNNVEDKAQLNRSSPNASGGAEWDRQGGADFLEQQNKQSDTQPQPSSKQSQQ
jgi:hypothetical protein